MWQILEVFWINKIYLKGQFLIVFLSVRILISDVSCAPNPLNLHLIMCGPVGYQVRAPEGCKGFEQDQVCSILLPLGLISLQTQGDLQAKWM